jgi:hypothetical protein
MSESTRLATESMCKSRMFVVYICCVYIIYAKCNGCLCSVCDRKESDDPWLKHLLLFGHCRLPGEILSSALSTKPECLI